MGDGPDGSGDEPRQPEHRGDPDQEGEHEQVQVVPVRLLQVGVAPQMNQEYLSSKIFSEGYNRFKGGTVKQ